MKLSKRTTCGRSLNSVKIHRLHRRIPNLYRGIYVKNRQDYETEAQQRYVFDVAIFDDEAVTSTVSLTVITINIFDNSPIISYEGPCVAEELRANFDTNCRFVVTHQDGTQDNPFQMVISGPNNENQRFTFSDPYNEQQYSREYNLMSVTNLLLVICIFIF